MSWGSAFRAFASIPQDAMAVSILLAILTCFMTAFGIAYIADYRFRKKLDKLLYFGKICEKCHKKIVETLDTHNRVER